MWWSKHTCYLVSAVGMNTVKNIQNIFEYRNTAKEGGRRGSLVHDAWTIKMRQAGQSCWWEHSGDAAWRSLDWEECRGQRRIIKRVEHTPSGITEGRMGNINRELYLLGKARRWKHWLRLFCRLGGTLWFMCWGKRNICYAKVVLPRQLKWDQTWGRDSLGKGHVETKGSLVDLEGCTFQHRKKKEM